MPDQIPLEDSGRNRIPDQIPSQEPPQTGIPQARPPPSNNKSSTLAAGQRIPVSVPPLVPFLSHGYLTTLFSGLNGGSMMKFVHLFIRSRT